MTEKEAKTKWCPFVRAGAGDEAGLNRYRDMDRDAISAVSCCIASECMAWQWSSLSPLAAAKQGKPRSSASGYCGLASR